MAAPTLRVESPAGSGYARCRDLLPGAVVSAVGYHAEGLVPQLHRGLPSPYLTFIFSLGDPIVSGTSPAAADGPGADRNDILVAGLHTAPTYVVQPRSQTGIQLDVHPLAARRLLGAPTARIPWQVTEGLDLLGPDAERVRERLAEVVSWKARFEILSRYLRRRVDLDRSPPPRAELSAAWGWLAHRRGSGSMDALARHVALSPRQLRMLFHRELGVGPKQVGRLMRFDTAKQQIAAALSEGGGVPVLTEIAVRCGYYDHPHLDAEFRAFSGTSPSDWMLEERRNIQAGGHRRGGESDT